MDERDVWAKCNPLKWWAQHFIAELVIAAVEVFDLDVHAAFRAVKASQTTQLESEWPTSAAGFSDALEESVDNRDFVRVGEGHVCGDLSRHIRIPLPACGFDRTSDVR
jgi:DNA integrity scanning protein DisA with diadenylate cyclase activity